MSDTGEISVTSQLHLLLLVLSLKQRWSWVQWPSYINRFTL